MFSRSVDEVRYWDQKDHPITKFGSYLVKKGLWDESKEKEWKESSRKEVCMILIQHICGVLAKFWVVK